MSVLSPPHPSSHKIILTMFLRKFIFSARNSIYNEATTIDKLGLSYIKSAKDTFRLLWFGAPKHQSAGNVVHTGINTYSKTKIIVTSYKHKRGIYTQTPREQTKWTPAITSNAQETADSRSSL